MQPDLISHLGKVLPDANVMCVDVWKSTVETFLLSDFVTYQMSCLTYPAYEC